MEFAHTQLLGKGDKLRSGDGLVIFQPTEKGLLDDLREWNGLVSNRETENILELGGSASCLGRGAVVNKELSGKCLE